MYVAKYPSIYQQRNHSRSHVQRPSIARRLGYAHLCLWWVYPSPALFPPVLSTQSAPHMSRRSSTKEEYVHPSYPAQPSLIQGIRIQSRYRAKSFALPLPSPPSLPLTPPHPSSPHSLCPPIHHPHTNTPPSPQTSSSDSQHQTQQPHSSKTAPPIYSPPQFP